MCCANPQTRWVCFAYDEDKHMIDVKEKNRVHRLFLKVLQALVTKNNE
jgi:hypothetical protein